MARATKKQRLTVDQTTRLRERVTTVLQRTADRSTALEALKQARFGTPECRAAEEAYQRAADAVEVELWRLVGATEHMLGMEAGS